MNAAIGLVITIVMVFGGYLLAGGKLDIILHSLPFEMMIIGGSAVGAFVASNDFTTIKHTMGDIVTAFAGPKWKKKDYQDLLCLMHELLHILKVNPVDIESHIEAPQESSIFQKYPRILKDHDAIEMICDTIRSMIMNFDNVYQVEMLLEKHLDSLTEDKLHGSHALQGTADALPALGIVAAVLGVIKTMASIDKPPEVLGGMIGGALVGTFLGVFLAYGVVGPFAARIKHTRMEEHVFYSMIGEVLVSNLYKNPVNICIEVARRHAPSRIRPSFDEIEQAIRELKQAA
ncbi:MAG: flagellar motor stator protein MotA [Hyphomonas sp.]|uniref:flagellar motor stator protein MotA n=1 Tax=Hyphomonas sp. TaxID=87 RepID=UPI00182EE7F2|nr:flagellar motor stator protein MotA [Hyphomonas sp.]MBA3067874.1 flagellar motor stator protein MotA [Hyphomonas sp.]MBU3922459.1 flagellar motor stator protein MotA [Alphaproteobacteria bacterium]MBU4062430.1 flagellar motor stator protein MotA [Alphaproteobacteria bacterium]MBU4165961.1 flagellar motor stator protein MotA [Alphaproteobacteria bacterium]